MDNVLNEELHQYISRLSDGEKQSVLQMLKAFKGDAATGRISLEQYNKEIDEALERANKGDVDSLDTLKENMKGW